MHFQQVSIVLLVTLQIIFALPFYLEREQEFVLKQKLDHFNSGNSQTWSQRYSVNDQFAEDGAPIFIFVNGRSVKPTEWTSHGHFYDIARELKATIYGFTPRFYDSVEFRPTENLSVENLKYLTTDQTLEDLANYVEFVKSENADSKVIIAGLGYGGNLAVWFRQKYPKLVDGVWSTRGSLEARFNFLDFFKDFEQQVKRVGNPKCEEVFGTASLKVSILVEQGKSDEISSLFKLCKPLNVTNKMDVTSFYQKIIGKFVYDIFLKTEDRMVEMCNYMTEHGQESSEVSALASWMNQLNNGDCLAVDVAERIKVFRDPEFIHLNERQQYYQSCSEIGQYITSDGGSIFGETIDVELFTDLCSKAFNKKFTNKIIQENVDHFNAKFGGSKPSISNAIIVNAERDPMRLLNIQENSETVEVFNVPGGIYEFSDLKSITESDDPTVRDIKERIRELIVEWVSA